MGKLSERKGVVHSIVGPYMGAKKDRTMEGIYKRIKPCADGKLRTVLSASGTETGRLSSSESISDSGSTNMQNLPKITAVDDELYQVRDCLLPEEGMLLLGVDYDKAEAVCVAAYSGDWPYYDRLIAGEDVHSWHAGYFFGRQDWIDGAKADYIERSVSKNTTYASNYMAGIPTIAATVNKRADKIGRRVSWDEVERIYKIYFGLHPLKRWWNDVSEDLLVTGSLENAFGFKRHFYEPDFHRRLKEALAFLPQSTVASNINRSLIRVGEDLDSPGDVELLLQVHDELLLQVREDRVDDTYRRVREIMEEPFEIHGREVYIPASGKVGACWGQMTEILLE